MTKPDSDPDEGRVERVVEELARHSRAEDIPKVDRQFHDKLARLRATGKASAAMVDRLQLFWRMLRAPDDQVPWRAKALLMAAVSYFVSPVDLIPDLAGKAGYLDDALVVHAVHRKLRADIDAFVAAGR